MKSRKTSKDVVSLKAFIWECSTRIAKTDFWGFFAVDSEVFSVSFVA